MSARHWFLALSFAIPFVGSTVARAEEKPAKEMSFGTLSAPEPEKARGQALDWLKAVGKTDDTTMKQFETLWARTDRPLLERVAGTIALGDAEAAKILAEARDPLAPAPTAVPKSSLTRNGRPSTTTWHSITPRRCPTAGTMSTPWKRCGRSSPSMWWTRPAITSIARWPSTLCC